MKILSITAQKPHSTGSGVYLTGLVKGFAALGHEQAVVAGVYEEDEMHFPEGTRVYPVYYKTESLPFPIAGMSRIWWTHSKGYFWRKQGRRWNASGRI